MQPKFPPRRVILSLCFLLVLCFLYLFIVAEVKINDINRLYGSVDPASPPQVSLAFSGSGQDFGAKRLYDGHFDISFYNPSGEKSGGVQRITLQKYAGGSLRSSRTIYLPWYNLFYTWLNNTSGIFCSPFVLFFVERGEKVTYTVCVETEGGNYYKSVSFPYEAEGL